MSGVFDDEGNVEASFFNYYRGSFESFGLNVSVLVHRVIIVGR